LFLIKRAYEFGSIRCANDECKAYDDTGDENRLKDPPFHNKKYKDYNPYEEGFLCPECKGKIDIFYNDVYQILWSYTDSLKEVLNYCNNGHDILEIKDAIFELNLDAHDIDSWEYPMAEPGAPFLKRIYSYDQKEEAEGEPYMDDDYDVLKFSPYYYYLQYNLWTQGESWYVLNKDRFTHIEN
jgi:hypothetical protein